MSGPRKEVEGLKEGVDKAQDAVRASLIGLFTSAQEVLKLLQQFHTLSKEQLSDISHALDYINNRHYEANKNIRLVQEQAGLTQGKAVSPQADKTQRFLEKSNEKLDAVNAVFGEINKAINKIPMEHGHLPPPSKVDVGMLQAQANNLKTKVDEYNKLSETLRQAMKQQTKPSPAAPDPQASTRKLGK